MERAVRPPSSQAWQIAVIQFASAAAFAGGQAEAESLSSWPGQPFLTRVLGSGAG